MWNSIIRWLLLLLLLLWLIILLLYLLKLLVLTLVLIVIMLKFDFSWRRGNIFKSIYSWTSIYILSYLRVSLLDDRTLTSVYIILVICIRMKVLRCLVLNILIIMIIIIWLSTLVISRPRSFVINGWYLCHNLLIIRIICIYVNNRDIVSKDPSNPHSFIHRTWQPRTLIFSLLSLIRVYLLLY